MALWLSLLLFLLVPLGIGLLLGIDRRLTARMQNRVGPPLLQPYYDLGKLFGKERNVLSEGMVGFAIASLLLQVLAWTILAFGGDLLLTFFLSGAGTLMFTLGAFSARSPFSQMGAQRELLQVLAYEPVLFLAIFAIGWQEGNFFASEVEENLLLVLPLVVLALIPVVLIKMQKSPYDIATSHQELVSGPYVEYSGPYLGVVKLAHWFELAVLFGIISLFFYDETEWVSGLGKLALVLGMFFLVVWMDNSTARLTRGRMVRTTLIWGIGLVALNFLILLLEEVEVL